MKALLLWTSCLLALAWPEATRAAVREGPRTMIPAETFSAGGGRQTGSRITHETSLGALIGEATAKRATTALGYLPQTTLVLRLPLMHPARVRATCLSLEMPPFAGLIQGQSNTNYVTSYDGLSSMPATNVFSQESRPRAGAPGTYEADFVTFNSTGAAWQYGSFTCVFPSTDQDHNLIPDALQFDQSGETAVSGESLPDYPAIPRATLTGQMHRDSNSFDGHYEILLQNGFGTVSYAGNYRLLYFEMNATYSREPTNRLFFAGRGLASPGLQALSHGATTFTVLNPDQIRLEPFALFNEDGSAYQVKAVTLDRQGHAYVGRMSLVDGHLATPGPDFTEWVLELSDETDANGNGIPDLSDSMSPNLDTDHDGLPDDFERRYGLDAQNPADALTDLDGDGQSNLLEFLAGTDPADPASILELTVQIRANACWLSFVGATNRVYQLEYATELHGEDWRPLGGGMLGQGTRQEVSDAVLPDRRFYRLVVSP